MQPHRPNDSLGLPYGLAVGVLIIGFVFFFRKKYMFDSDTEVKLAALQPAFRFKIRLFLVAVQDSLGLQPFIVSGFRSYEQQLQLHHQDKRNPAPDANNPDTHMRGIAVDLNFKRAGVLVLLKGSPAAAWAPVVKLSDSFLLTWGGRFAGYPDNNHFDGR